MKTNTMKTKTTTYQRRLVLLARYRWLMRRHEYTLYRYGR